MRVYQILLSLTILLFSAPLLQAQDGKDEREKAVEYDRREHLEQRIQKAEEAGDTARLQKLRSEREKLERSDQPKEGDYEAVSYDRRKALKERIKEAEKADEKEKAQKLRKELERLPEERDKPSEHPEGVEYERNKDE